VNLQLSALHRSIGNLPALEQELSGRLRVTMALDVEAVLAEVVERFVTRHPRVELELRLSNSYVDLVAEGMDLGLRFATRRLRDSSLRAKKLCPSVVHLYASPSYLVRRGEPRTPRDLDQHEWIVYRAATQFRLQSADRSVQVVTRGRIACDDMGFVRAAVGRGLGLGYLSPHFANNEVAAGRLVRVLPQWSCHISDLWAVWPGGHKLPRNATAFLGVLRETLGTDGFL
jgi:DNA-binding transcriptional LysR family regulator